MPEIVFDKVEKRFGTYQVLPPLDLRLADGEFTVLVGPSGCGKSTTLRILAGLEPLSGGEIYFDGRPIGRLDPKDRDIAMVFQDYALYPHMTIAKNMSFALRLQRRPKSEIDAKVKSVATMLNIAHLLDRKPAELSGGQRQRVAMGRAMVRDASSFLFDEPLSNLDAKLRARMRTELAEMRQRIRKNMIYVTHDQVEAMTLGDRIVVMKDGVIQQQGSPQDLFERPVNRFVAGFIGSPTMNFLDGELRRVDDAVRVIGDGFDLPVDAAVAGRIGGGAGRAVTIGIRPQALRLSHGEADSFDVSVVVAEYLGSSAILVCRMGEAELLIEMPSGLLPRPGDVVCIAIDPRSIILFDRQTEMTL